MAARINIWYLALWMATVSLGMFQFGYAIAHFNIFTKVLYYQYAAEGKEVVHDLDNFNSFVTTIVPIGATFGAFTGGALCSLGRRPAIFIANAVIFAGSAITMIFNFYALIGGRLLIGYGAGAYTVIAPLFISETSPAQIAGSMGAINQFMVTAGIMVADILGFVVPYSVTKDDILNVDILTTKVWRAIFIVPACLAVIQSLLILFVFRNDTPKFYKQKRLMEEAERVEELIYHERGTDINKSNIDDTETDDSQKVPLAAHCSDRYRTAFIVGCVLAIFQQLTGINAVIFYSNDIFIGKNTGYKSEQAAKIGTMLVGVVNWAAAMASIPLLIRFGRKTLLIFGQIGMTASVVVLGILAINGNEDGIKVFTLCFVAFFEFSIGPILWLYAAEIMTETGMSAASLITWIVTIIFGLFTGKLFDLLTPEGMYFTFAGIDIVGLVFILFVIKETKGLSKDRIQTLYAPQKYQKLNNEDDSYTKTNDI
jgi:sugar porter (SP) family MFS transporter